MKLPNLTLLAGLALALPAWALAVGSYEVGALSNQTPPRLPGHIRAALCQTGGGGPLRISLDGHLVPNVYVPDPRDATPHVFQYNGDGDKLHLKTGFHAMLPADEGGRTFCLADLEVNAGQGMRGLNGVLVTRCTPTRLDLVARVHALDGDVDKVAAGLKARIQPFFTQKEKGRDVRVTEVTWLSAPQQLQVRFARSVGGRSSRAGVGRHGPTWRMWNVPYLTVLYRLAPDGRQISRTVVPPGDPVATAKQYNPALSPW